MKSIGSVVIAALFSALVTHAAMAGEGAAYTPIDPITVPVLCGEGAAYAPMPCAPATPVLFGEGAADPITAPIACGEGAAYGPAPCRPETPVLFGEGAA